jgi:hypothetical protein
VFIGLILVTHAILWAIGELFFQAGIIWLPMPFFWIYGVLSNTEIIDVLGGCGGFMCGPNILGWFIIVLNIVATFVIYYFATRYIIRRFLKKENV